MKCGDGTKQPNAEVGALSFLFPNMNPKVMVVMVVSAVVEEVRTSYLLLICLYSRYVRMFSVLGLHYVTAKTIFGETRWCWGKPWKSITTHNRIISAQTEVLILRCPTSAHRQPQRLRFIHQFLQIRSIRNVHQNVAWMWHVKGRPAK